MPVTMSASPRTTRRPHNQKKYQSRTTLVSPRLDLVTPGGGVALDTEGAIIDYVDGVPQFGDDKEGLAQTAIVDVVTGVPVYNRFGFYSPNTTPLIQAHLPPQYLNVGAKYADIRPSNGAVPITNMLHDVERIIEKAGFVVAHAIESDKKRLRPLNFSRWSQRDTQKALEYQVHSRGPNGPKLRVLSEQVLGEFIQGDGHDALVDATQTRKLYMLHKASIDIQQAPQAVAASQIQPHPGHQHQICDGSELSTAESVSTGIASSFTSFGSMTSSSSKVARTKSTWLAPGNLVALPDIKEFRKGRTFDMATSTYR